MKRFFQPLIVLWIWQTITPAVTDPIKPMVLPTKPVPSVAAQTAEAPGPLDVLVTRHGPKLNRGRVDGSIRVLEAKPFQINGNAVVNGVLYVPGSPAIKTAGNALSDAVKTGDGNRQPAGYTLKLNGNSAVRLIVTCTDPVTVNPVPSVPSPSGTRDAHLIKGQSPGDFATLRNLTLTRRYNLMLEVPEGSYGDFTAHGTSGLILGAENRSTTYNLQALELNSRTTLQIRGTVTLNIKNGLRLNSRAIMGKAAAPADLSVNLEQGGATFNSRTEFYGILTAPSGTVTLNADSQVTGRVVCDRASLNSNSQLKRMSR